MRTLILSTVLLLLASTTPAQPRDYVSLQPVKEISEYWIAEEAPASIWSVRDGVIACTGEPNGFLRSRKSYRNFVFRAEWRFQKEGWVPTPADEGWPNAGFFIFAGQVVKGWPTSLEVQGHFGEAGSLFGVRGGSIQGARRGPIVKERPAFGDWDRYEITAQDGSVRVVLNGKLVNEGHDAKPAEGNICLQSEGWPVYYRKLEIRELPN